VGEDFRYAVAGLAMTGFGSWTEQKALEIRRIVFIKFQAALRIF
jgi:hypothetical protein